MSGDAMNKISKSVMTVAIIFGTAFLLAALGCSDSSSSPNSQPVQPPDSLDAGQDSTTDTTQPLQPLDPSQARECTDNEFSQLIQWRNQLDKAHQQIDATGANETRWQKTKPAVEESVAAVKLCDSRIIYHREQPCKKTTKTIVNPNKPNVKVYDEFHLTRDCSKAEKYLNKFGVKPNNPTQPSNPEVPSLPNPAPTPDDGQNNPPTPVEGLASCSNDEFANLTQWAGQLDLANKSISKMGSVSSWKFDANAINFSTDATSSCEKMMAYHSQHPCQKLIKQSDGSTVTRQYTADTLAQRCEMARTYFYEFQQRTKTLNSKNADLYLDLTQYAFNKFPAQSHESTDNCVIDNPTDRSLNYSTQKALIVDSRGFEDKIMVLETAEGLIMQCYGLELDGPFSKNQIIRLLKAKNTNIKLEYILK